MMSGVLYRFEALRMSFGRHRLLDIDALTLQRGSCCVLSGRNGAGKTTLLKIVAGLLAPDAAHVRGASEARTWRAARRDLRRDICYLHQQPYMFDRSVAGNIRYAMRRLDLPPEVRAERTAEALQWCGLAALARRNARSLSGGERQRLALARARATQARALLLDEPIANLDAEAREETFRLLGQMTAGGLSVLATTHEPGVAERIADLHLILEDGRLRCGGTGGSDVEVSRGGSSGADG